MNTTASLACMTLIVVVYAGTGFAQLRPFDGQEFKGRIAFSSDGNFNDEDDWGAFPVAAAILDAFGVTDKLVHVDYNNILVDNDQRFYREMTASVVGCIDRYHLPRSVLFDCQKDVEGAVESIKNAINASSSQNPLYYVLAGPMEVPFRGIEKSDPAKRKHVYCISHSAWNDGYTRAEQALHRHNKRDVIPSGINWIQVKDGNPNLAHPGGVGKRSSPQQWQLYRWLKDSRDARLNWIYTRLVSEGRADISDATMTYFLLTGDEDANLDKLRDLLDRGQRPVPAAQRKAFRIEAENFLSLAGYRVDYGDRRASHRLSVRSSDGPQAAIETPFRQPYSLARGLYRVAVRYRDQREGKSRLTLFVDGDQEGEPWLSSKSETEEWKTHIISDVVVKTDEPIKVAVEAISGEPVRLDFVELRYQGRAPE